MNEHDHINQHAAWAHRVGWTKPIVSRGRGKHLSAPLPVNSAGPSAAARPHKGPLFELCATSSLHSPSALMQLPTRAVAGKLFNAMHSADADQLIKYIFPVERLPAHTQVPNCCGCVLSQCCLWCASGPLLARPRSRSQL